MTTHRHRSGWAALGAAVAVTLGASGGFGLASAARDSGERSTFVPISPCRLADTRASNQIGQRGAPLGPNESYTIEARGEQGQCSATDLPDDATALVLNVTALGATSQTFLTFWPSGDRPEAASLNPSPGAPPIPNAVITQLAEDGSFRVFNERGNVNVVIDVSGFYVDHNHDDRYYTEAETDARFAQQADVYSRAEVDQAILDGDDNVLNVLSAENGPIKTIQEDVIDLETAVAAGAPLADQVLVVGRLDFRPFNIDGSAGVQNSGGSGAFVPSGASNNQLWAPLDLPVGATVTTMNAFVIDNEGGTVNLSVELRADGVGVDPVGTDDTATSTGTGAGIRIFGTGPNFTVGFGQSLEIVVQPTGGGDWSTLTDGLQIVKVVIVYDEAGA